MTEPGIRDSGNKPAYDQDQLRSTTVTDLKARIGRISSQQARHIAVKLWQSVESCFLDQYGQMHLKDEHTIAQATRRHFTGMLELLNKLADIDLGDIIVAGPQELDRHLESLHPLVRLLLPPARTHNSFDAADRLGHYLEFYMNPDQRIPGTLREGLIFSFSLIVTFVGCLTAIILLKDNFAYKGYFFGGLILVLMAGVILSAIRFAGFGKKQAIALYISFTDEFMDDDPAENQGEPQ